MFGIPKIFKPRGEYVTTTSTLPPAKYPKRPACIPIDEEKITDFGQQVASLLALAAKDVVLYPGLRAFNIPKVGHFEFADNDILYHVGNRDFGPGSKFEPGLRILTKADQKLICDALAELATSGVDATQNMPAGASPAVGRTPNPVPSPSAKDLSAYAQQMKMLMQHDMGLTFTEKLKVAGMAPSFFPKDPMS